MKKILLAACIFIIAAGAGIVVWAQQAPAIKEKPQWVLDHGKGHAKKHKPVRKVSGTAKRGAKQVSPLVLPKNK